MYLFIQKDLIMLVELDKKEITRLYEEGMNPEDIAEELGLDEIEVIDYCSNIL